MGKRLDLTGQRFGRLTVLRPAENIGGRTAWVCRCDCGQETVVLTNNLRSGRTRGCGGHPNTTIARKVRAAKLARENSTGGVSGVEWLPLKKRWKATIYFKGKRYFLDHYLSFDDAVAARKRAENARKQAKLKAYNRFLREFADTRF